MGTVHKGAGGKQGRVGGWEESNSPPRDSGGISVFMSVLSPMSEEKGRRERSDDRNCCV